MSTCDPRARRLVEQRADLDARGRARAQQVHQVGDRQPGVDDVLDEEHVLVLDGPREVLRDLHDAARLGPLAVRAHAEEVDAQRQVDGARQVRRRRRSSP